VSRTTERRPAACPPASTGRGKRRILSGSADFFSLGLCALLVGCGESLEARSGLEGAFPSDTAAIQAALEAVEVEDRDALEGMLLTRDEHRTLVWDSLPEKNYFSFDYVRLLNEKNSKKAITRALERYGGQNLELVGIEYGKGTETYDDVTLHRGAQIRVRRSSDGEEGEIALVDVLFERNGGWKLMNYVE
jgi:hypothetical protein